MHLEVKTIKGRRYLYAAQTGRVDGKPRRVKQIYLGTLEDLVAAKGREGKPASVRTHRFGAVAALWALSDELGIREEIDRHCAASGPGASIGTYLVLAAINRSIEVRSKRGFVEWYQGTSLPRLAGVPNQALTSQDFWTAMDRFPVEKAAQPILTALVKKLLPEVGRPEVIPFDATNFFTFIASDNSRPKLPQRGHNKAKRHDLRQVGWALAAAAEVQMPLFSYVYAGNQVDVVTFKEAWPQLLQILHELNLQQATLVFDRGNMSKKNLELADQSKFSYVTSLAPHFFPDLMAVPLSQLAPPSEDDEHLHGFGLQRVERMIWGRERVVVQSWSPNLARGQEAGVNQHLSKAERKLSDLQASLRRRQQTGYRGRKVSKEAIEKTVRATLRAQHLSQLLKVTISEEEGHLQLSYTLDESHLQHLRDHLFGRRIWVTDHRDWSVEQIVHAGHQQSDCENCFRDLHGEDPVAWTPMWHWTDQKIRVHAFYMVLSLLLTRLLLFRAHKAGDTRGLKAIIADLHAIDECLLVYPAAGTHGQGRPRLVKVLSDRSHQQQQLLQLSGADRLAPPA
jgi:transposase